MLAMGPVIIGSMIIWAGVIFSTAYLVPEDFGKLIPILGGGVAGHLIILGAQASSKKK